MRIEVISQYVVKITEIKIVSIILKIPLLSVPVWRAGSRAMGAVHHTNMTGIKHISSAH